MVVAGIFNRSGQPVAAQRIESLDAGVGTRERAEIARPAIVVEDHVAIKIV